MPCLLYYYVCGNHQSTNLKKSFVRMHDLMRTDDATLVSGINQRWRRRRCHISLHAADIGQWSIVWPNWDNITPRAREIMGFIRPEGVLIKALIGSVRVGSVHAELRPDPNST